MVDVMGHFGMALLWAAPVWVVWDGRVSLAFVGLAVSTAMLPDVDLVLQSFLPVTHHGVTHTFLFVGAVSLVAGAVVDGLLAPLLERHWSNPEQSERASVSLFVFTVAGLFVGGSSHLFADMLSAPDIAPPVEPFWPFFDKPWSVDVLWYNSVWWNLGLLSVAVVLHLALAYVDYGGLGPPVIQRESGSPTSESEAAPLRGDAE